MAKREDARKEDIYHFLDLNETIDSISDQGDYGLRPPPDADRIAAMKSGKASIVRIPRQMLAMLQ